MHPTSVEGEFYGNGNYNVDYFLVTDAMMVGVCMFAYGGKEEYSEGMIFGVHIPKGNVEEEVDK